MSSRGGVKAAQKPDEATDEPPLDVALLKPSHPGYAVSERAARAHGIADGSIVPEDRAKRRESSWVQEQPFLALDDAARIKAGRVLVGLDNHDTNDDEPRPLRPSWRRA